MQKTKRGTLLREVDSLDSEKLTSKLGTLSAIYSEEVILSCHARWRIIMSLWAVVFAKG